MRQRNSAPRTVDTEDHPAALLAEDNAVSAFDVHLREKQTDESRCKDKE